MLEYFDLQAYLGTTKHMGGLLTTEELVELCHINEGTYTLDVGCGVGATACYLAKQHGCRVVGVDIREAMVTKANERARREGVETLVEFKIADACNLPFDDDLFDAAISESVATFIENRQRMISECARVTGEGGYVGLNEETWLKTPPPKLADFATRTWDIPADIPSADGWRNLLENAGLSNIVVRTHKVKAQREATQIKRYRLGDMVRMFTRTLRLYITSPAFREYMAERQMPSDMFDYLGYTVLVGRT